MRDPTRRQWLLIDRMIVARALIEGISVLSSDRQLDAYGIRRLAP